MVALVPGPDRSHPPPAVGFDRSTHRLSGTDAFVGVVAGLQPDPVAPVGMALLQHGWRVEKDCREAESKRKKTA